MGVQINIFDNGNKKVAHRYNEFDYELNLVRLEWTKHDHTPKSGKPSIFPEEYKRFEHSSKTLLATEADDGWRLVKVISVHRLDVTEGQNIQFHDETMAATSDDFIFIVAYTTSEPFSSEDTLRKAVNDKNWPLETQCTVCRTVNFPEPCRYIGYEDISEEEREAWRSWKKNFDGGEAKIL